MSDPISTPIQDITRFTREKLQQYPKSQEANGIRDGNERFQTYQQWVANYSLEKTWKDQQQISATFGTWIDDASGKFSFHNDIWKNLANAYIGKSLGFTEQEISESSLDRNAQLAMQVGFDVYSQQQNLSQELSDKNFDAIILSSIQNKKPEFLKQRSVQPWVRKKSPLANDVKTLLSRNDIEKTPLLSYKMPQNQTENADSSTNNPKLDFISKTHSIPKKIRKGLFPVVLQSLIFSSSAKTPEISKISQQLNQNNLLIPHKSRALTEEQRQRDLLFERMGHGTTYKDILDQPDEKFLEKEGYRREIIPGLQKGMFADVYVPIDKNSNLQPILSFRGTNDLKDLLTDLDPDSVGYRQFLANNETIRKYLQEHNIKNLDVTGHSLGGALGQKFVAHEGANFNISRLVTFQSPGISAAEKKKFEESGSKTEVVHHIADNDLVHYAGEAHLSGVFYEHDLENSYTNPHKSHTSKLLESTDHSVKISTEHPGNSWLRGTVETVRAGVGTAINAVENIVAGAKNLLTPHGSRVLTEEQRNRDLLFERIGHGTTYENTLGKSDEEFLEKEGYRREIIPGLKEGMFADVYLPIDENSNLKPILSFRGTYDDIEDLATDFDPSIGQRQFSANQETIRNFLKERNVKSLDVTGHSLGGALAQKFVANEGNNFEVSRLVTFQSPGISAAEGEKFEGLANKPEVIHHMADDDIVHNAGEYHLPGKFYKHDLHYDTPLMLRSHPLIRASALGLKAYQIYDSHTSKLLETTDHSVEVFDHHPTSSLIRKPMEWGRKGIGYIARGVTSAYQSMMAGIKNLITPHKSPVTEISKLQTMSKDHIPPLLSHKQTTKNTSHALPQQTLQKMQLQPQTPNLNSIFQQAISPPKIPEIPIPSEQHQQYSPILDFAQETTSKENDVVYKENAIRNLKQDLINILKLDAQQKGYDLC